MEIPLN